MMHLWLPPRGEPKPPMKEVVGEEGEPSVPSRAVSGFISGGGGVQWGWTTRGIELFGLY